MTKKQLAFITAVIIFIISKFLGWSWLISTFLGLSIIILYFLNFLKNKIISNFIWAILIIIDSILLILLFVPVKAYNINPSEFYAKQQNYLKIYIKDPPEKTKYMAIIIWRNKNNEKGKFIIKLSDYKKNTKIPLFSNDKIYFLWNKKNKTYAAIYLWDWSILRITPWTKLKLAKITKNLENLTDSQTQIKLESWNIWFHIIKLIKNSSNMQIQTSTWQMLIIRWTAWLISKPEKQKTYAIDYSHYIEIKNKNKSAIIKAWEWAVITDNEIYIIKNIQNILKQIWLSDNILKTFPKLDKQDIENYKKQIIDFLKKQIPQNIITTLENYKIKLFSIWDKNYKNYLEKLETYQYLLWETKKITNEIKNNPNIAFIASNIWNQQAKLEYLYNQLKQNIQNSDIYKTYIINLWISWKIKNISSQAIEKIIQSKKYLNNILNQLWK